MKSDYTEKDIIHQLKDKIDTLTATVTMLKRSEKLLANAINDAPIGMITLTVNGKFKTANSAFCQMTGYTEKELLAMNISQITHPDDKHIGDKIIADLTSGKGKKAKFHKRYIHKNGNAICAQVSTVILRDEKGNPRMFFTQVIDITERRQAEQKLIQSEENYRGLFNSSTDAIYIQDKDGRFLDVNKEVCKMYGYSREYFIGKTPEPLAAPGKNDLNKIAKYIKSAFEGEPQQFEFWGLRSNGEVFPKIVRLKKGKYFEQDVIIAFATDITDRKQAEEMLKESEERFRIIFDNEPECVKVLNPDLTLVNMNLAGLAMIEAKSLNEVKGQSILNIINKEFRADFKKLNDDICKKGISGKLGYWITGFNGTQRYVETHAVPLRNFKGEITSSLSVTMDITKRKQAEKEITRQSIELEEQYKASEKQRVATLSALADLNELTKKLQSEISERKKSEKELALANKNLEMLGQTVQSMNECVSITDKEHKIIFVNEAWEKMYGFKMEEVIGKTSKIIETKEEAYLKKEMRLQTKLGGWKGNLINKTKDGTRIPIELSITPLKDKQGKIIAQIGITTDISDRIQAEKIIKDHEANLKQAQQIAKLGYYSFNIKTGSWTNSDELNEIFGINKKFKRDITGWIQIIHPDFQETMSKYFQDNILQQHQNFDKEYKIISLKTRQEKWVHGLGTLKFDEKNNPIEMFGTIQDITDRKSTEEALLDSEIKYRQFFMDDLTGDYLSTREGKIIDCNPQFLKIFGFKSLNQAQKYDSSKLYKSESERDSFIKKLEKNKVLVDEQSEQYKVSGEKIIIRENVSGEFDDDGNLINIRGYIYDITDIVKAEQEITKLSSAVEQSPVSIVITDTKGVIEYVNPTFEKLTGYTSEEALGAKPSILKSGVTPDSEYSKLWNRITAGKVWIGEFLNKKKNGELYWESATVSPIFDNKNNITHFLAVKEDVTKKKEIVSELMEREEKYRTLTQNLNVGVYRSTPGNDGIFIEANPAFIKIFGFRSKNELERYKTVDFYADPIERNRIEEKLTSKGFLINEEVKLKKKDGSIFFASISSTSATDELGKVIHHDGIVEDITERKEMMERVIQERDRSQLYLDIAGVMFLALDKNGNIILANQKTCEIVGTKEKDLIGKNWIENHIPKSIQLNLKDILNNLLQGNAQKWEFHENEILTTAGEKRLIAWHNNLLKDESGKIFGVISSGLDITESKKDEELRNQLYKTSRSLAESLDIDVVLNRMSKQARALLNCNGVTIYMCEDDKKTLKPVVAYDPPYTKQVLATNIGIDNSFTGQAIKAKKGKIFNYKDNLKGAFHIEGTPETDTDNIIVSPLQIDGKVIGALTLVRSEVPFTEKDLNIVNTFAVYGSTAIKNANSHKQILREIEERKHAQKLLKESHDRYESIFNGATDGIIYTNLDGNIISVNSSIEKLFSIKRKDLVGKNAIELAKSETSGKTLKRFLEFINRILKGEEIRDYLIKTNSLELEFSSKKGQEKSDITVMVRDVTERNIARKNVELHQNNLATLSNELTMAEEKAKRHLAITLHDKLGQSLVLANFRSNELNKIVKKPEHKKIINEISGFLADAINESRNITYELSPPVLYEMGLVPAINWKLDEIEKNNKIKTSLINKSKSHKIGKREQIILYRSINELLQNVLKHSKAESVNVSFRLLTNDYRIIVRDNGIGFDLNVMKEKALSQKKFGLFSIIERIKYIGGSVEIDTKPKKGTKIIINMPIKNK